MTQPHNTHTPTPWKWDGRVWDYDPKEGAPWLVTDYTINKPILTGEIKCDSEANAAFIVTACNAHHTLIEYLSRIKYECTKRGIMFNDIRDIAEEALNATNGGGNG